MSVTETTMRLGLGSYIVLGCLPYLFSLTSPGWSDHSHLFEEKKNQVQIPVVIMTLPAVVEACDNLLIDLSASWGHLGRHWVKVAWTVTLLNSTDNSHSIDSSSSRRFTNDLVEYLTKYFDPITSRVVLPLYLWRATNDVMISLTASLTNYLQKSSSDTRVVMIRSGGRGTSGSSGDELSATRYSINTPTCQLYFYQPPTNTYKHPPFMSC